MALKDVVTKGKKKFPPRIIIYGAEKIGKSTFGASAPNPIFLPTEDGIGELDVASFPLAGSLKDVKEALSMLVNEEHDYGTLVIDSLDWLERLVWDYLCQQEEVDSIEKVGGGYGKGYVYAVNVFREILAGLTYLRERRNMVIIGICHARVEKFQDPEGSSYDRYSLKMNKSSCELLKEWSDCILFASKKKRVSKEKVGSKERTIAAPVGTGGGERILTATEKPACVAGNRYGLPDEFPLSWPAFVNALATAQAS